MNRYYLKNNAGAYFKGFFYYLDDLTIIEVENREEAEGYFDKEHAVIVLKFLKALDYNNWRMVKVAE